MTDQTANPYIVEPYAALASVYQAGGFAAYSLGIAPQIINAAFELDWTGGTLLDLGCGTGDLACWFAGRGLRILGLDSSPAMLRLARQQADAGHLSAEFAVGDMRTFAPKFRYDMVTCIGNSLNYMPSLKDLERTLRVAHSALAPGRLFLFDLRTVAGLAAMAGDRVVADVPTAHFIVSNNRFNFETMTLNVRYSIFQNNQMGAWNRSEELHALRGYPVQAVQRLLEQIGFRLIRVMDANFSPTEPQSNAELLIFLATTA